MQCETGGGGGGGGGCDLALADSYGTGVTLYLLLTGCLPVLTNPEEEQAAAGSLRAWEAALLRRVRNKPPLGPGCTLIYTPC